MQIVLLFWRIWATREAEQIIDFSISGPTRPVKIRRTKWYRWKNTQLMKKEQSAEFLGGGGERRSWSSSFGKSPVSWSRERKCLAGRWPRAAHCWRQGSVTVCSVMRWNITQPPQTRREESAAAVAGITDAANICLTRGWQKKHIYISGPCEYQRCIAGPILHVCRTRQ